MTELTVLQGETPVEERGELLERLKTFKLLVDEPLRFTYNQQG